MRRRWIIDIIGAGVVAGIVVACSGGAVEMLGEMMEDAGTEIRRLTPEPADAGRGPIDGSAPDQTPRRPDAAPEPTLLDAALRDATTMISDAAKGMRDAGDAMMADASAQSGCTTCTTIGAARTITADSDPDQLVTKIQTAGGRVHQLNGPFVLTDVVIDATSTGDVALYGQPDSCDVGDFLFRFQNMQGVRIKVEAGQGLCALTNGAVLFSGFVPYN